MVTDNFARAYPQLKDGLQAVPIALTAIPVSGPALKYNAWLEQVVVSNTAATAVTLTVQDAAGNKLLSAVSLAANSNTVFSFPRPVRLVGGVSWLASAAGLIAEVKGYYV